MYKYIDKLKPFFVHILILFGTIYQSFHPLRNRVYVSRFVFPQSSRLDSYRSVEKIYMSDIVVEINRGLFAYLVVSFFPFLFRPFLSSTVYLNLDLCHINFQIATKRK